MKKCLGLDKCLREKLDNNKYMIFFCCASVFIWGLFAHAYAFLNSVYTHDSLLEFNANVYGNHWKVQLGRFFVPIYRALFGSDVVITWYTGLLGLLWISVAVFLVIKMFNITEKCIVVLISGIMTVNMSVSAIVATYMHDFDSYMFAVMMAVMAVFLWHKYKYGFWVGSFCITIVLGTYQAFISVAIVLVILESIIALLSSKCFKEVFVKGFKGIVMLLGGGLLYVIALKLVTFITGIELVTNRYNSLDHAFSSSIVELLELLLESYKDTFNWYFNVVNAYPQMFMIVISILLLVLVFVCLAQTFFKTIKGWKERILLLGLLLILPVGMNVTYILSQGMVHYLMVYAIWLVYVFALLLSRCDKKKIITSVICILVGIILLGNVKASNMLYLKKSLEHDANLSYFTRVLYSIEDSDEYISGKTPIVLIGEPQGISDNISGFEKYNQVTGMDSMYSIGFTCKIRAQAYFRYIMANPVVWADENMWAVLETDERVIQMPSYPTDGCIQMIDGILVVKLSN